MTRPTFDRRDLALIALAGLAGATLRWLATDVGASPDSEWFAYAPGTAISQETSAIPYRTLAVNLAGTFVLGAVMALRQTWPEHRRALLALGVGFCGSLTTFSSFAVEVATRLRGGTGTGSPSGSVTIGSAMDGFRPLSEQPVSVYSAGLAPIAAGMLYLVVSLVGAIAVYVAGRLVGSKLLPRQLL